MLAEVRLQKEAVDLIELYKKAYAARHGNPPIIAFISKATDDIKDLLRQSTQAQMAKIIEQYLKMDGDGGWFVRNGHSVKCLCENIAQVVAATPREVRASQELAIVFWSWCPACKKFFELMAKNAEEASEDAYIVSCKPCGSRLYPSIIPSGTELPDPDEKTKPKKPSVMSLVAQTANKLLDGW